MGTQDLNVASFGTSAVEEPEMGLVIAENDAWVLVKHIPADYVIDGFRLYRKKYIISRKVDEEERRVAKVLRLKGTDPSAPGGLELADTLSMLRWIEARDGIFEIWDEEQGEVFYGRIHKVENGLLTLEMIDADGGADIDPDHDHVLETITVITFGSDYLRSLRLLWQDRLASNGTA